MRGNAKQHKKMFNETRFCVGAENLAFGFEIIVTNFKYFFVSDIGVVESNLDVTIIIMNLKFDEFNFILRRLKGHN